MGLHRKDERMKLCVLTILPTRRKLWTQDCFLSREFSMGKVKFRGKKKSMRTRSVVNYHKAGEQIQFPIANKIFKFSELRQFPTTNI